MEDSTLEKIINWFSYRFIPWFFMISKYIGILVIFYFIALGINSVFNWDIVGVFATEIILAFLIPRKLKDVKTEKLIRQLLNTQEENLRKIISDDGKIDQSILDHLMGGVRKELYSKGLLSDGLEYSDNEDRIETDKKIESIILELSRKIKKNTKLTTKQLDKLQKSAIEAVSEAKEQDKKKFQTLVIDALKEAKEQGDSKKKILLIDDDKFLLNMYKKRFEETSKYDVATIQTLNTDFVTQIFDLRPDMIISDNVRPGPDGIEVMKAVKNDSRTKDIPFVFLSNTITSELIEESKKLGVAGIICKGDTIPQEVVDEITRIFNNLQKNNMVTINKKSDVKAIQFIGSPFRGPKAEELKEKNKASKPRVYIDIAEMYKAGMSQEEIKEKVKEVFKEKGILKP